MSNLHAEDELHRQIAAEQAQETLQQDGPLWRPETDIVPTPEVAKAIQLAVAGAFYGEEKIRNQQPFVAVRSGDFWVVSGSLPKKTLGGKAITVIRAANGEILQVSHGR